MGWRHGNSCMFSWPPEGSPRWSERAASRSRLPCCSEMYEPLDFLYRTPQAVEELLMLIRRTALPLYLQRIPAASPTVTFVEKIFERRALIVRKPAAASPLIRLDESWIEPESHLNSGRRSDLRRARRTSEKLGAVGNPNPRTRASRGAGLIGEVLRVEAAGWKGAAGTALAADPVRCEFFHRYCAAKLAWPPAYLPATHRGTECGRTDCHPDAHALFAMRAGYDEAFARSSPGNLLTRESIRHAALARNRPPMNSTATSNPGPGCGPTRNSPAAPFTSSLSVLPA